MMIKLKKYWISVLALCALLFLSVGIFLTKPTKADEVYTSPLPNGAYVAEYSVLDINKGALTGNTISAQEAMGDASAVRFKLTATAANTWATYISLYSTTSYYTGNSNEGSFYFQFRQNATKGVTINLFILSGSNPVGGITWDDTTNKCMTFDYPSWFDVSVAGKAYNIEVGGVRVVNDSGAMIGTLFYMEVDGARIAEYYYANSGLSFAGDNFNYLANQTAGSLTTTELGAIDASTATVAFTGESYGVGATPVPAVTLVTEKEGGSYGSVIAPQYFDVTYTDNDKSGTATATVTFKGKYSGTATATFKVVGVEDMYESPIPEGARVADYTVLDINKGALTGTTITAQEAMDDASAVRFKLTETVKNTWNTTVGLYSTSNYYTGNSGEGSFYFTVYRNAEKSGQINLYILSGSNPVNDITWNATDGTKSLGFTHPEWFDLNTDGNSYNIEVGGVKVVNDAGVMTGTLFYLEVDGCRIVEYYYANSGLPFAGDNFNFNEIDQSASETSLTAYETIDLTGKTSVAFGNDYEAVDGTAMLKPIVYRAIEKNGKPYVGIVEERYYDVAYTALDKAGTAEITFKGKYSGTATGYFTLPDLINANGAVVTLVETCFTESANDTPITPLVIAVEKDGKAIPETCYSVSYEDNVEVGTGKVIVMFKNGYFGTAIALFRINPILTENHFLDENPVILDVAETYGGTESKIELTEVKNYGYDGVGGFFDMNGADVVRFKMTTNKNAWNQYFALFCSDVYYRAETAGLYYALPNSDGRKLDLIVLNKATTLLQYAENRPTDFDIYNDNGVTVNVEIGAVKIFYNDDGDVSYAGRMFYIEFDGKRALEYVYLNADLKFEGGNFFIGGNTDKIVVEKFDLAENNGSNGGHGSGEGVSASVNGGDNGASLTATGEGKNKEFIPLLAVIGVATAVGVAYIVLRKHNKSEKK